MRITILLIVLFGFEWQGLAKTKDITPSNYIQTVKCFPALKSDSLKSRFSLNNLRDKIDEKYPSLNDKLLARNIFFTKDKVKRVMRLVPHDTTYEMIIEDIGDDGELKAIDLPLQQRRNATQTDINQHLLNAEITSDEKTYDDTKLNNHKLSYKLTKKDVVELVFRRLEATEKLYCHVKDRIGPVCICK
jgi:hypothetical protein